MKINVSALELLKTRIDNTAKGKTTFNQACIRLGKLLGYNRSYIAQMYQGKYMSETASEKIIELLGSIKPRHRIHIEFETVEDKERALALSNTERVRRLLK